MCLNVCFAFALLRISVCSFRYYIGMDQYGAWYAGLSGMIYALWCLNIPEGRVPKTRFCGMGTVTIILVVVGCFSDGFAYAVVNSLMSCTNSQGDSVGSSGYFSTSSACALSYASDCACVNEALTSSNDPTCFLYDGYGLSGSDSCSPILDDYPNYIYTSYIFCMFLLVSVMFLSYAFSRAHDHDISDMPVEVTSVVVVSPSPLMQAQHSAGQSVQTGTAVSSPYGNTQQGGIPIASATAIPVQQA